MIKAATSPLTWNWIQLSNFFDSANLTTFENHDPGIQTIVDFFLPHPDFLNALDVQVFMNIPFEQQSFEPAFLQDSFPSQNFIFATANSYLTLRKLVTFLAEIVTELETSSKSYLRKKASNLLNCFFDAMYDLFVDIHENRNSHCLINSHCYFYPFLLGELVSEKVVYSHIVSHELHSWMVAACRGDLETGYGHTECLIVKIFLSGLRIQTHTSTNCRLWIEVVLKSKLKPMREAGLGILHMLVRFVKFIDDGCLKWLIKVLIGH